MRRGRHDAKNKKRRDLGPHDDENIDTREGADGQWAATLRSWNEQDRKRKEEEK